MSDPLTRTIISAQDFGNEKLNALHARVREADHAWREAWAEHRPDAEVRALAQVYVDAAHAFQRAKYGKVRVTITVSRLMR